jgi:NAD(P)-dependent dehydrogenase (short-subunit alcohol dehydrogenase family)
MQETASARDVHQASRHIPAQEQGHQPGDEQQMDPRPEYRPFYPGVGKFKGQVVLITGGDSGIGRATALAFANEGAHVAIIYKDEDQDAAETRRLVTDYGTSCLIMAGDIGERDFCFEAVVRTVKELGRLDVLINNAAEQWVAEDLAEISEDQLERTFRTNIFSQFFLIQAALEHLPEGGSIINNASVNAFKGNDTLMDYTATKGAIIALTRSLATNLIDRKIRVNAVAPGPIWTPLIPASFPKEKVKDFGSQAPMKRVGQPNEVAGCFTWLASLEAGYVTGQTLHPNGGYVLNT